MTPAIGIPLERVAPAGGMELCGKYFQAGTVLGVNAWVVHMDQEVYGADAASWRPGRWVEASPDKRKEMDRALFAVSSSAIQINRQGMLILNLLVRRRVESMPGKKHLVLGDVQDHP